MPIMRNAIGVLLAGGQGERLWPLTRDRAKPAVPFGGVYRIIDLTLSNCLNSDLRRVFVLTQYKALSLNRHVRRGLVFADGTSAISSKSFRRRCASRSTGIMGTADAVYQNIYSIGSEQSNYVFILSGDHIYKMNYQKMLEQHVAAGADVTVATIEMDTPRPPGNSASSKRTNTGASLGSKKSPPIPKSSRIHPGKVNASMGVYIFNTQLLVPDPDRRRRKPTSSHDFGKDILPRIIDKHRVFAYNFRDENKKETSYWRDVGTIDAYHEANMDLVSVSPVFNLYDKSWPLHSWQQQYPPAKFVFADPGVAWAVALDSVVSGGSIVSGGRVERSVLGYDVRVNSYSEVDESIVFNHVNIGRHCRIRRAIIDRHVDLPEGTVIGYDARSRPRPLFRPRWRHCRCRSPRIHDRRTGIAAEIMFVSLAPLLCAGMNSASLIIYTEESCPRKLSRFTAARLSIRAAIPRSKPTFASKEVRSAARRFLPAHRRASMKRSNCATAISRNTSAKASLRPSAT